MIDPITAGAGVFVGALGFAQGFVNSRARRERHAAGD